MHAGHEAVQRLSGRAEAWPLLFPVPAYICTVPFRWGVPQVPVMDDRLFSIYVEDHLALSLGGIRLAKRCLSENRESDLGRYLEQLIPDLMEDRNRLLDIAGLLAIRSGLVKQGARFAKEGIVVASELLGRLKPNGRLLGYSDLSRLEEIEALLAGSSSRAGLWRMLARIARREPRLGGFDFARLEERAQQHQAALERFRMQAGEQAFLGARVAALRRAEARA